MLMHTLEAHTSNDDFILLQKSFRMKTSHSRGCKMCAVDVLHLPNLNKSSKEVAETNSCRQYMAFATYSVNEGINQNSLPK